MVRLRAGQVWQDIHDDRTDRLIQIRHVAREYVVVTSSNNRTTHIKRSSFSSRRGSRLRFRHVANQPDPKLPWDQGLQQTAEALRRFREEQNSNG